MPKSFLWICLSMLIAAVPILAQTPAAAPAARVEGQIIATRVRNEVFAKNKATSESKRLNNNDRLAQNYVITTGKDASVVLVMSNGATVQVGAESELDIEKFEQDPFADNLKVADLKEEPGTSTTKLKLVRGELVGKVVHLNTDKGSEFTVQTAVGAAGIRGTSFRIIFRPTGNGSAYQFQLNTTEGRVLLEGGVAPPAGLAVTDNKEIVIELTSQQVTTLEAALNATPTASTTGTTTTGAGQTPGQTTTDPTTGQQTGTAGATTTGGATTGGTTTGTTTGGTTNPATPAMPTVTVKDISVANAQAVIAVVQNIVQANAAVIFVPVNTPVSSTTGGGLTTGAAAQTADTKETPAAGGTTDASSSNASGSSGSSTTTPTTTPTNTFAPAGTETTAPAGTGTGRLTTPTSGLPAPGG